MRGRIFIVFMPQGSILGPVLFNIFINGIFSFLTTCNMCNYVDDNTLYTYSRDFHQVQEYLKKDFEILITGSMTITWSLILINVNSWVLEKPMKMRYLPIMKSDLKKYY